MRIIKQALDLTISNTDIGRSASARRHGNLLPPTLRCLIVGPSNCGKTNVMLGLIEHPNGLKFENIYIYSKSLYQEKYRYLKDLLKPIQGIHIYMFNNCEDILKPSDAKENSLFIFDDVACDKQSIIQEYFSMGRHKNVDSFYLCQTYTRIPKHLVRDNANILVLFKQDNINLKHVYDEHIGSDLKYEQFMEICSICWTDKYGFIVIDKDSDLNNGRFRKGLNGTSGCTNGDINVELDSKSCIKLFYHPKNVETSENQKNITISNLLHNNAFSTKTFSLQSPYSAIQIKKEEETDEIEQKPTHSIIGLSNTNNSNKHNVNKSQSSSTEQLKRNNSRNRYHESLQRIGGGDICYNQYQQHWFSSSLELLKLEDKSREERLEITRYELQRHLKQIMRSNLGKPGFDIDDNSLNLNLTLSIIPNVPQLPPHTINAGYDKLVPLRNCDMEMCNRRALPCTRYCELHIMQDLDQALYTYCTAKFADNRQCTAPVCDTMHELPLCKEHARKRDNYRSFQEAKPKKLRKKVKPSAMIRPQKRHKKKRRPIKPPEIINCTVDQPSTQVVCNVTPNLTGDNMVEQVLALHEPDGLELVAVEQALVTQATSLLEESEINNVLSTIQGHEFSDFFTVNRNGEYEPTREEAEELERALQAVDNDVKSLEKLTQSQGLLDTFLDEHTLVESLVQIPDVFHNGYAQCGDNIVTQTSRLLSVDPHLQS